MPGSPGTLPAPDLPPGPRLALVIATTTYTDPELGRLRAPAQDAVDLRQVLADPEIGGFTVTSVINQPAHRIRLAVEDFLTDRGTDDVLLVYLSCHGLLNAYRRLFFAAEDTRKDRLGATGVEAAWMMDQMEHCRARQQILILDSCFSGAFSNTKGDADVGLSDWFTGQGRGRIVLTASNATEYSYEGEPIEGAVTAGSVFTAALVDGLRTGAADVNHDGHITVEEAYTYAYDRVRAAGAAQTPQRWAYKSEGTIVLARSPAGRILERPALPEALRIALDSPLPGIRVAAVGELGTWLNSGDPAWKQVALEQLHEIADRDNPQVAAAARALLGPQRAVDVTDSTAEVTGQRKPGASQAETPASHSAAQVRERGPQASWDMAAARSGAAGVPQSQPAAAGSMSIASAREAPPAAGSAFSIPSRPLAAMATDGARVNALAFSPDGKTLAAGLGREGSAVLLLDPVTGQRLRTLADDSSRVSGRMSNIWMEFSPDGRQFAASGADFRRVRLWDPASGQSERDILVPGDGMTAGFTPDGRRFAVACSDGTVHWYDPATGQRLNQVSLAMPRSKTMEALKRAVSGARPPDTYSSMRFSPGLGALATGSSDGGVRLWNPETGEQREAFQLYSGGPATRSQQAAWLGRPVIRGFSPKGGLLVLDGTRLPGEGRRDPNRRGLLDVRDAATGELRHQVPGEPYTGVAFSPDGNVLATGEKGSVLLSDAATGKQLGVLPQPARGVSISCMAFGPHGGLLAVAESHATRAVEWGAQPDAYVRMWI